MHIAEKFSLILLSVVVLVANSACVVDAPTEQQAVLVTGATSGIGRTIAERLANEGYFVYAGARKQADIDELNAIENIQAVRLDVTIQSDIDAAVQTIRGAGRGLHGLVNNAGVITMGALHEIPEEDLLFQFDVNVYGVYRVTKAFVPLIAESEGRIVNIGSVAGILTGSVIGAYSMSKHAIEAYTDSLAGSLNDLGISVSVVEPGTFRTNIMRAMVTRLEEKDFDPAGKTHGESMQRVLESGGESQTTRPPDPVADAVLHALFDPQPRRRYLVSPDERTAERTIRKQLEELAQLNAGHDFSYDREELIEMLDEALAAEAGQ